MRVEVLYTGGCGSWQAARDRVAAVARSEGVPITLDAREVRTPREAQELRFPGSPTVRVEGRDLQPGVVERGAFGLG